MSIVNRSMLSRANLVMVALSLTACPFDLDDPTGAKARLAQVRRAECQQVWAIQEADYQQGVAIYEQDVFSAEHYLTEAGHLKQADIHLATVQALERLELDDENLGRLATYLAASFRHRAKTSRDLAPFAEVERTVTQSSDRAPEHQAIVTRENPYDGVEYAIEIYCEGDEMPASFASDKIEKED